MRITPGRPAYAQVADDLRQQIRDGDLPVDAQLPSMAQLCSTYDVSNTVIRDALNELRRDGLIVGQQGKGVFVTSTEVTPNTASNDDLGARLDDLTETVRRLEARLTKVERATKPPRTRT